MRESTVQTQGDIAPTCIAPTFNTTDAQAMADQPPKKRDMLIAEGRSYRTKAKGKDFDIAYLELTAAANDGKPWLNGNIYVDTNDVDDIKAIIDTLRSAGNDLANTMRRNGLASEPAEPECNLDRSFIGRVAVCSVGKVGLITAIERKPWGWAYVGWNLNTGEQWSSTKPTLLATSGNVADYIRNKAWVAYKQGREGRTLTAA